MRKFNFFIIAAVLLIVSSFWVVGCGRLTSVELSPKADNGSTVVINIEANGASAGFNSPQTADTGLGAYGGVGGTGGLGDPIAKFSSILKPQQAAPVATPPLAEPPKVEVPPVVNPPEKPPTPPPTTPPTAPPDTGALQLGATKAILWKPVADSGGNLVILIPAAMGAQTVSVADTTGKVIETGKYVGVSNPDRPTYRFTKPGKSYPAQCLVKVGNDFYYVKNSASRLESLPSATFKTTTAVDDSKVVPDQGVVNEDKVASPSKENDDGKYTAAETFVAFGKRNQDRWTWRIKKSGPEFGPELKAVFSNGYTVYVKNTTEVIQLLDGFVFKPGVGTSGSDTFTAHEGVFLHAPHGNPSDKVTFFYNSPKG